MDVVMLYRFGDWYVLYYDDLEICAKHITIMVTPHIGSRQIGFKSCFLDKNIHILTELGYKVALCEQMENRTKMEERLKKNRKKRKGGCENTETESESDEDSTKENDEDVPEEMRELRSMKR